MGANSKIEWTDHTFNPWIGCSKVSDGCKNCYAEEMMDHRFGKAKWGPEGTRIRTSPMKWNEPFIWDRKAAAAGERHRVFCASLADVFEDRPELREWRYHLFRIIDLTPNLDWLLLTKRPENVVSMIRGVDGYQKEFQIRENVWIGTSVENQEQADKRIPELLKVPAAIRFLSMEPLLGPVDLTRIEIGPRFYECSLKNHPDVKWMRCGKDSQEGINWVIVGGESGRNARPMHPDWARSLCDQCQAAGVPFLFKQWGEWKPLAQMAYNDWCNASTLTFVNLDGGFTVHDGPDVEDEEFGLTLCDLDGNDGGAAMAKIGKHAAGRTLDGRTWDEVPDVTHE